MKHLSLETVITLHSEIIAQTGGLNDVRDANMLDDASPSYDGV